MNLDQYYLNEAYNHEEREKEDVYKVWMIFISGGKIKEPTWYDSDENETRLKREFDRVKTIYPKTEIGWIWNTDFNHYRPDEMYRKLEKL